MGKLGKTQKIEIVRDKMHWMQKGMEVCVSLFSNQMHITSNVSFSVQMHEALDCSKANSNEHVWPALSQFETT